ncbi:hypothetical protein LTS08_008632 [Lithohypha guttulata]|uniref:NAD-dependent epimerase/dehydratase domain-containing protein n=1 Tax=Lithohypha guttulata TaxID=1690604 RepID=A0AAN7PK71_9EURO|nr:hypothetical protein LTR51_008796 [Lithohypha guttulata]KAK5080767.1 hypothetical protein LTR05_008472 [Lithohypha guttulata]KAK5094351.1 hypothetical protein LTS08_008632 [Lithohypha guttulata]
MLSSSSSSLNSSPPRSTTSTPCTEHNLFFANIVSDYVDPQYILVTGGLGFIGSHTSLELLKAGYNVLIVDDLSNSYPDVFDRILAAAHLHFGNTKSQCPKLKLWKADYRDECSMRRLFQTYWNGQQTNITGVIHFAAFKAVEESIRNPLRYYLNNINGMVVLLGLLEEFDVKNFIFSSSATVYGSVADRGVSLREEDCVHRSEEFLDHDGFKHIAVPGCIGITNPYGRTKYFGEAILSDLAVSDPTWNIIALRYFNPIGCDSSGLLGEDPRDVPSNLLPIVVKVMTGQWQELSIYGADWDTADGTAIRDFIHVSDLARGHIAALETLMQRKPESVLLQDQRGSIGFATFNLGTGSGHSVQEVIDTMAAVSNTSIPYKVVGRRPGDVGSCVAEAGKANKQLCWQAQKSLKDACTDISHQIFFSLVVVVIDA